MSKSIIKWGILVVICITLVFSITVYRYQVQNTWYEQVYLKKTDRAFVEALQAYDADNLETSLERLNKIENLTNTEAIALTKQVSEEWLNWVRSIHSAVLSADYKVPRKKDHYGYNGYIVASEEQGEVLGNLNTIGVYGHYLNYLEEKINTNKLGQSDLNLIIQMEQHFVSIHQLMKNQWHTKAMDIHHLFHLEEISKMKEPFIHSLHSDIKKTAELYDEFSRG